MDSKMTTITAAEFVSEKYAAKIAAGECVVTYTLTDKIRKVTSAPASILNLKRNITHRLHFTDIDDFFDTTGYAQLTVQWLTPTAQPAKDTGGRYRLRRWDGLGLEWKDGISQHWDILEFAIREAQRLAKRDDVRIGVFDRAMNQVCDVFPSATAQPATASEDTAPTGAGVDYQTMWFSAAKQLAELRVDYDELFKELEEAPPQSLVDEQQTELTSLRAQVATLNAAIADYVDGCDGVGGSYEQARKSFDVLYEIRNRE